MESSCIGSGTFAIVRCRISDPLFAGMADMIFKPVVIPGISRLGKICLSGEKKSAEQDYHFQLGEGTAIFGNGEKLSVKI